MLSNEEIEKLIEDMTKVRPEMLNEESKRLFEAIMKIADIKDKLFEENKKLRKELEECQKKHGKK